MSRYFDLCGQQFSDWTVIRLARISKGRAAMWLCRCVCGIEKEVRGQHLRNGNSKGCGCAADKRFSMRLLQHAMSGTSEYIAWQQMKRRCYGRNFVQYADYGGRGISVCDEWNASFDRFYEDMGPKPSAKHSLDRINNDGPYCKENCRWALRQVQNRNSRHNRMLTHMGVSMLIIDWAQHLGLSQQGLQYRLKNWPLERALSERVNTQYQR